MLKILVTYAVQGEFTELKFPGLIGEEEVQVGYLRTGVGKVTRRGGILCADRYWKSEIGFSFVRGYPASEARYCDQSGNSRNY